MSSSDEAVERKTSRRRFIKWAGALVAVGVVGMKLGGAAGQILGQKVEKTATDPANQASTTTSTAAETETGTTTGTPGGNIFSVFWITDTQFLSEANPALFRMLTNWIVSNWTSYNGRMVVHTGDIVQNGAQQVEWENADEAMSILLKNGIPYTWCTGNHDDLVGGGWNGNLWASAFDPSTVMSQVNKLQHTRWVSDFHNGMNTAASFSANGLNFLVINIEWNPELDVLEWVGGLLDDPVYANYRVIIAPHAYIDASGKINNPDFKAQQANLSGLTALMDKHSSNVFLTLNGHFATEYGYNTPGPINNRNELMFDRQDCIDGPNEPTGRGVDTADSKTKDEDKVGGATVTILTFDTDNNQVSARTYDVYTGRWRDDLYERYKITMLSTNTSQAHSP